jgi:hypothetical protein
MQEIRLDAGSFGYQGHPDRDTHGNNRLSPNLALQGQAWLDGTPAIVTKGRFRSHRHPRVRDRRGWLVLDTHGTIFERAPIGITHQRGLFSRIFNRAPGPISARLTDTSLIKL